MKKYIIPLLALLVLSSCDDYADLNTNIYGATDDDLQMGGLVYGAPFLDMQQLVIPIGSPNKATDPGNDLQNTDLISSGNYIGYFGNNNNWDFNNEANWNFVENRMEYAYKNFYSKSFRAWNDLRKLTQGSEEPFKQQVFAVANIVKVLAWLRATDVFGPIVYTKAGDGDIAPTPDSQEIVYKSMLKDLDKSVEVLNSITDDILVSYDLIYNGKTQKWVKLANSVMLRMAVRVHFKDEALAKEYIAKALDPKNGGVIESQSDEAKIQSSEKMPLLNSMIPSVMEYKETRMGATIWGYLDGYKDPRLDVYFTKGTYKSNLGYYPVAPTNKLSKQTGVDTPEFASMPRVTAGSPLYWLRASEVCFLKAEAALYDLMAGDAKTFYQAGVTMSFSENGISSDVNAYLSQETLPSEIYSGDYKYNRYYSAYITDNNTSPKWEHLNSNVFVSEKEQQFQKIITQKYLALYPNSVEAWTEYRRTGYPYLMIPFDPGVNRRLGTANKFTPERFRFAPSEYSTNPNMSKVSGLLGGEDTGATLLWWVRSDRPVQDFY